MHTETELLPSINYNSSRELRAFLSEQGLGMRKKFGQNFLIDSAARLRLLDALELKKGDEVWEIGPGLGAMTKGLLEQGANVTAFEIDPAFSTLLRKLFCFNNFQQEALQETFRLVEGDVLKTWPHVNATGYTKPAEELSLLGNLPYNIAAALIADFIEKGRFFKRMVVTVQREVAQRMASLPGSKDYSSFSVLCSSVYNVSLLQVIRSTSFYPAPQVDSQGVRLDLIANRTKRPPRFYPLVRSLFSSRRKTLRNTLSAYTASVKIAEEVLKRAGISGERRAETLCVDDFHALAAFLEEVSDEVFLDK